MHSGSDPATILVVEDDAVLGEVLGRILTQEGHTVRQALTASVALDLIKDWSPRLVLLDACLRDGTGLKLAEDIRTCFSGLPIILLTAFPASESDYPGWAAGRLLSKSINLPDLRRVVSTALASAETHETPVAPPMEIQTGFPPLEPTNLSPANSSPRRTVKEWSMRLFQSRSFKAAALGVLLVLAVIGLAAAVRRPSADAEKGKADTAPASPTAAVKLVDGQAHTLFIPEDVRIALGIRKNGADLVAARTGRLGCGPW